MADVTVNNITADSADITDLQTGSFICRGSARFINGAYVEPTNGVNINTVTSSTAVADTDYVLVSNGTSLRRVLFTDFVAAIRQSASLNTASSSDISQVLSEEGI